MSKAVVTDEIEAHLHLIRVFCDDMNDRNWGDKRVYIKQQADRITAALSHGAEAVRKPGDLTQDEIDIIDALRVGKLKTVPALGSNGSAKATFDVIAERIRQREKEGWTPEHDDAHKDGELAQAASVYAHPFPIQLVDKRDEYERGRNAWPWYDQVDVSGGRGDCPCWGWRTAWMKKTDRRRDLVKAAALIIAEIERIDRAAIATKEGR